MSPASGDRESKAEVREPAALDTMAVFSHQEMGHFCKMYLRSLLEADGSSSVFSPQLLHCVQFLQMLGAGYTRNLHAYAVWVQFTLRPGGDEHLLPFTADESGLTSQPTLWPSSTATGTPAPRAAVCLRRGRAWVLHPQLSRPGPLS